MSHERRQVERVRLHDPLAGFIGNRRVWIVEFGLLGCRIEHGDPLDSGKAVALLFHWAGNDISINCRVTHCEVQPILLQTREIGVYQSGLAFEASSANAAHAVRQIVSTEVTRMLDALKMNARGETRLTKDVTFLSSGEESVDEGIYTQCRLSTNGSWVRSSVYKPNQPPDGFTVTASTTPEEIETLCRAYEQADGEGRRVIRMCAELSVTSDRDQIPPQKFIT